MLKLWGSHRHNSNKDDAISSVAQLVGAVFAILSIIILLAMYIQNGRPESLNLRFNWYALLSAASFVTNAVGFFMLLRVKVRSDVLQWFAILQLSMAAWAAGELLLRLSATPAGAALWAPITTLGSVGMPITLFMFSVAYTNAKAAAQPIVVSTLFGASALYLFVDSRTNLFTYYDPALASSSPWGFVQRTNPTGYILISLWLVLLATAAFIVLFRFWQRTIDPVLKQQSRLFLIAIAIPLIGGGFTDGVLPALNIVAIPPLSVVLMGIMGVIITYGIIRYRFFSFTPGLIANQILGTMNEAVIGVLPDFRIRYVNGGAEQLFGMPAMKFGHKHLSDFLSHSSSKDDITRKFDELLRDTSFGTIDSVDLVRPDGTIITAKMSVTKLMDRSQPYGYLVVLTDITEIARASELVERQVVKRTKELHEEQAKLRAAIEGIALGFILIDDKDRVIIQNKPLQTIFGLAQEVSSIEELDRKLNNFDLREHCLRTLKTGHSFQTSEVAMGSKILQIFIGPVRVGEQHDNKVIGIMLMVEDVTEEKVLARSKDEFFSIASHELRTPLTAIKGNTSIMIDYYKPLINQDDSFKQMVFDIYSSSARLIDIVNDFLNVSRIEQGKMVFRYSAFPVDKVIESVFYEMRAALPGKKVKLTTNIKTLDSLPIVWADRDRITQIIYNLVGNSIKFTAEGTINVMASTIDKFVYIEVTDTGRGVSISNQKLLFHKFQQAGDSLLTRDTTRGTGLGLYISKLMAQSMNCSLGLKSSVEGKGSTFYIKIPVATKQQLEDSLADGKPSIEKIDVSTGLTITK